MLTTPLKTLKQVIDQPSGSLDQEDVTRQCGRYDMHERSRPHGL